MPDSDPIDIAARQEIERVSKYDVGIFEWSEKYREREVRRLMDTLYYAADILEASGIKLVTREATEEMYESGWDRCWGTNFYTRSDGTECIETTAPKEIFRAMWDAAPVFGTPPAEGK